MKAFSTRLQHSPRSSSSPGTPDLLSTRSDGDIRSVAASQKLAEALTKLKPSISAYEPGSTAARLAAFASPCFFHSRFDDAVDIDRVLEEIAADESMSHSRLVQSATAVREVSRQLQRHPIKRAVKNVMIVTKARDNSLVLLTRELAEWLIRTPRYGSRAGVNVYVDEKLRKSKRFDAAGLVSEDVRYERMLRYWNPEYCRSSSQKFDLVITLGGDGTVLFTSWLFQQVVPPILSFSLGSLGFLTPFEFSNYRKDLNRVMGGTCPTATPSLYSSPINPSPLSFSTSSSELQPPADPGMRVNLRMRFTCTVYRAAAHIPTPATSTSRLSSRTSSNAKLSSLPPVSEPHEPMQFEVLNELVIDRGPSPYVSNLELFGDDSLLTVIQADGVIFSTPTGSTAYSLSAGGSLVHPDIPAILLTPICPHTLSFRPMLLNDTMMLKIAVPRTSRATAYCSFDGKNRTELRRGDYVTISASRYPFPTVVGERTEWIDSVSRTLRWNTREAQQKDWGSGRPQHIRANSRVGAGMHHVGGDISRTVNIGSEQVSDAVSHLTLDKSLDGDVLEDGEEEQEEEDFDIDIDESEDKREVYGADSGYGGDGSTSSAGAGASPARQDSG